MITAFGLLGIAAGTVQFTIDLLVWFLTANRAEMGKLFDQVQAVSGGMPVIYTIVPTFFWADFPSHQAPADRCDLLV
ncbi:hypothetical protein [Nonomuraea sp. NPDC050202]|uniref:hypothetical protein n=1 Tax=Nonomuraea sp. NPDC050202 TaxID=3155035 RepID=UPI0034072F18